MKINTQEVHVGFRVLGMHKDLRVDWERCKGGGKGEGEEGEERIPLQCLPFPHSSPGPVNHLSPRVSPIWPFISHKKPHDRQSCKDIVKVLKGKEASHEQRNFPVEQREHKVTLQKTQRAKEKAQETISPAPST